MEFLKLMFNRSKVFYVALAALSLFNGLLYTGLLMFVNRAITQDPLPFLPEYDWAIFAGLILVSLVSTAIFQRYMIRLTNQVNFDFELTILKKLRKATLQDFDKLGDERVYTAMNDIRMLVNLPEVLMNAINALIILACCFGYLFFVSWVGGLCILGLMVLLFVFYTLRNNKIERDLQQVRSLHNTFYQFLYDLLLGFKEIKISAARNKNIYDKYIYKNRDEAKNLSVRANTRYMTNELIGRYSWFLVIGVVIFALPRVVEMSTASMSAFLITILYMVGQVAILITLIPTYTNVRIALGRLTQFDHILKQGGLEENHEFDRLLGENLDFNTIRFEQIVFEYYDDNDEKTFTLGPIDLEIHKGETLFITGGNGSGKSTFVNILTGLYKPTSGTIYVDGEPLAQADMARYHERISAIFTHPHLFSHNYNDFELREGDPELKRLESTLQLEGKLRVEDNHISHELSKGQQKRLAMIFALLEEKPVLVLDEWAAEQDPQYRKYFYTELIPALKKAGKTIIAVTHDDNYYDRTDRILKFDFGHIAGDERLNRHPMLEEETA